MTEEREVVISKEKFLALTTEEIRNISNQKGKPRVGIFVADGTRRLVMCRARLSPTSDAFYKEYARFFTDSFKESLNIFFDHGLETLFFPLFGPSLLSRKNKFQSITIPDAYRKLFQSDEWFQFYKEKGIRVRAYGDLSKLERIDIHNLNMAEGIRQTIEKTASQNKHTLFFGFMSDNTPGLEAPQMIIDFFKTNNSTPTPQEMIETYYGCNVPCADFFIFSDKLSMRTLPPLISHEKARMYYLPVPGFLGFSPVTYRKIMYDLLFVQPYDSIPEYSQDILTYLAPLDEFFHSHKDMVIGIEEKIGK